MIRIAMLQLGRALLVVGGLFFIVMLIAAHPPFLMGGAVRTESQAIAIAKRTLGEVDPELMRVSHPWQAELDCYGYFKRCSWMAGFREDYLFYDDGAAYVIIDPRTGEVTEKRTRSGGPL